MEFAIKKTESGKNYLPWETNKEGPFGALVLRYWGCSLSCAICYAQSYAYLNMERSRVKGNFSVEECEESIKNLSQSVGWTRIQGGEPLLDYDRAIFTAKLCGISLKYMGDNSRYETPRVIIQTNGLWLGKEHRERLNLFFEELLKQTEHNPEGRIIIELSLKGSNKETIKLYADTLGRYDDIFEIQKEGFYKLMGFFKELVWKKTKRIAFYPVGGYGPQLNNPGFIPIDKRDHLEYPLFHPDTWNEDFRKIMEHFKEILTENTDIYLEFIQKHNHKVPLECMEPSFFQRGWTSQIRNREELRNFLISNLKIKNNSQLRIFNRELAQLQIPAANDNLLSKVEDLKEYFYEAEPADHYPFL